MTNTVQYIAKQVSLSDHYVYDGGTVVHPWTR